MLVLRKWDKVIKEKVLSTRPGPVAPIFYNPQLGVDKSTEIRICYVMKTHRMKLRGETGTSSNSIWLEEQQPKGYTQSFSPIEDILRSGK